MQTLQLITLNIWGGHVHEPLLDFFEQHQDVDIFCLQEVYQGASEKISTDDRRVYLEIFSEIQQKLPNHIGFFRPVVNGIYGLATFVHKRVHVLEEGAREIHHSPDYSGMGPAHSTILQWLQCRRGDETFTVVNTHGLWNGQGKTDSAARIGQSEKILEFLTSIHTPIILAGDFNLRPDTKSLAMLEQNLKNLITLNGITSTRTRFYPKDELFADYILTSPEVEVQAFEVLKDEVSDHAPVLVLFAVSP